jgi:hypothetical protein
METGLGKIIARQCLRRVSAHDINDGDSSDGGLQSKIEEGDRNESFSGNIPLCLNGYQDSSRKTPSPGPCSWERCELLSIVCRNVSVSAR